MAKKISKEQINLGTGADQFNASQMPLLDSGNNFTTDYVEDALFNLANLLGPVYYARSSKWKLKGDSTAADRYTLVSPSRISVNINNTGYFRTSSVELDLSSSASWDDIVTTDWTTASNRVGKDFYIYACVPSSGYTFDILLSNNSTYPDGYTTSNSRKIGGFHCLCADNTSVYSYTNEGKDEDYMAEICVSSSVSNGSARHWLTDFVAGDILPFSIWDLDHKCNDYSIQEGLTFSPKKNQWIQIYLPSWDNTNKQLLSVYGGTISSGATSPAFHQYRYAQVFGNQGMKQMNQEEFVAAMLGNPNGRNITGSADPGTTGGHVNTASVRIISNIGVEDGVGVYWQWGSEGGATNAVGSAYVDAYDGNDLNVGGQHYEAPNRPIFGGGWAFGVKCGVRGSRWTDPALILSSIFSGRAAVEPKK